MMANDDWVRAAMTDDTVVVELLIRLKQSQAASPSAKSHFLPFTWGLKQPRSKLASASHCGGGGGVVSRKKDSDSTRCSPTTPLSWSGSASPSATADGYEDSSRPTSAARSKVLSLYICIYTSNSKLFSASSSLPLYRVQSVEQEFWPPDFYPQVRWTYAFC